MNPGQPPSHRRRLAVSSRNVDALLQPLCADPEHTALMLDIDGTLATIVKNPERATIPQATRGVLRRLHAACRLLGVVTGRRALNARQLLGLDIDYAGNHGLEHLTPGSAQVVLEPSVAPWRDAVRDFVAAECAGPLLAHGVRVEDKDIVVTLHWRGAKNEAAARLAALAAADAALKTGLRIQQGRGIVEIRPPVAIDKGTAVVSLLDAHPEIRHVLYAGDDTTDVDAMRALALLKASGRLATVVRVGVSSAEVPAAIIQNADVMVGGPRGVRRLLLRLDQGIRGTHLPLAS